MTHYYSRESKTRKGEFTIMQVANGKESLVARTPRGDMAAHLVTQLNITPLPVKAPQIEPELGVTYRWGENRHHTGVLLKDLRGYRMAILSHERVLSTAKYFTGPNMNAIKAELNSRANVEVVQ